ncbi:MAG: hypothetical protein H7338_14645 [Candidatus Sericytochromatia bacterium]|nr:hypothetical protein [Candidatus Sericytochromatia bacterium]
MANDTSTIQSLKAVDAWIDVINANINGGVRTAFKSSRLKFGGSNTSVQRTGNLMSLPLQMPETSLTTANSVIDFSQGAITTSTENTHLAVQGTGWFLVTDPLSIAANGAYFFTAGRSDFILTRDGEFHTNQNGLLVTSYGYVLISATLTAATPPTLTGAGMRAVVNDLDSSAATLPTSGLRLSTYLTNTLTAGTLLADGVTTLGIAASSLLKVPNGQQNLTYSKYGSTAYSFNWVNGSPGMTLAYATSADATILNKTLEASNASMTQSVPELSLAQKLFSALTKVLQISQTNTDAVLNLIR